MAIVSDIQDGENLLDRLNNNLNLDSIDNTDVSDSEDREQNFEEKLVDENAKECDNSDIQVVSDMSSSIIPSITISDVVHPRQRSSEVMNDSGSGKRKRKQWTMTEKLSALNTLEKNLGNKKPTAHQCGCSHYQLSQ